MSSCLHGCPFRVFYSFLARGEKKPNYRFGVAGCCEYFPVLAAHKN